MAFRTNGFIGVDPETGEVIVQTDEPSVVTVKSPAQYELAAYYASLRDGPDSKRLKRNTQGNFIWSIFDVAQEKLLGAHTKLRPATLTRVMVLATYITKHGYLGIDEKSPMTRALMGKALNMAAAELSGFLKELRENEMLQEREGLFFMSPAWFRRGAFSTSEMRTIRMNSQSISRVYRDAVRELYKKAYGRSSLYRLSYLFRVMPYVNRRYNVVCFNPEETDSDKIEPLSLGDVAELVGRGRTHAKEFRDALSDPLFEIPEKGTTQLCRAVCYVSGKGSVDTYGLYINPRVYYAGNNWDDVAALSIWKV